MRRHGHFSRLALLLVAPLLVSCAGATLTEKNGLDQPERTLILLDPSLRAGLADSPAISRFVHQVNLRSHGRLRIDVRSRWLGSGDELRAVHDVAAGRADLGWAQARTLDEAGATSLSPLERPMLIDSYPLEATILTGFSRQLTADVQTRLGVTVLALMAGPLRFPSASDHPIASAVDWAGRAFWTGSEGSQQVGLKALGVTPVVEDTDRLTLTEAGTIDSAEVSWRSYPLLGYRYFLPFVAPNVHLWPAVVTVFANPSVVRRLSDRQRGWLRGAAAESADWAGVHAGEADASGLREACRAGAKASLATTTELARMRSIVQAAYAREPHPTWVGRLEALVGQLSRDPRYEPPVDVPPGCGFTPDDARTRDVSSRQLLKGPGPTSGLPRGRYRYAQTRADIVAASKGLAVGDLAQDNAGVWTWTIGEGKWSLDVKPTDGTVPNYPCAGWLSVTGDVATFTRTVNGTPGGDCAPSVWSAHFRVQSGRVLWSSTDVTDFSWVFQAKVWQMIR